MATSTTARLGLKTQAAGDNPGAWEVDLNAGLLACEARFYREAAGDPTAGAEEGDYIGQRYYDTTLGLWWTCTATGTPGTWIADVNQVFRGYGLLSARLEYVDDTTCRLVPASGTSIFVEIDGVIFQNIGNLVFDITADIFGAAEAASTAYYLYLYNDAGVLTVAIGAEAPDEPGGTKPGYNPTNTGYRCVGSRWNNSSGHLHNCRTEQDGWTIFGPERDDTDHMLANALVAPQADYNSLTLNIPASADEVRVVSSVESRAGGGYMAFAPSDAAAATLPDDQQELRLSQSGFEEAMFIHEVDSLKTTSMQFQFSIADRSTPVLKYGHNITAPGQPFLELAVQGYKDIWAPRGF